MLRKSRAAVLATMCLAAGSVPAGTATISVTYFEDRNTLACNSGTQCSVVFPVLQSSLNGKLLLVESVNCLLNSTQAITRLMRRPCSLAAGMLLAPLSPAGAVTISGSYYEDSASANCLDSVGCTVLFNQFPSSTTGFFVTVIEVGCEVNAEKSLGDALLRVTDAGVNARRNQPLNAPGRAGYVSFRERLTYKITGGPPRQPSIVKALGSQTDFGDTFASCTLVGVISSN